MHVVTSGCDTVTDAQNEMMDKIKALPKNTYRSMYPFDTAVVHFPDIEDDEKHLFTIKDGYWGVIVLLPEGQTFAPGKE
jgi:hypothetical protein